MPSPRFTFGTRVIVRLPDDEAELLGTLIGGPVVKRGMPVWKVQHEDFENWYPIDWLRPAIRPVD
jgi:hypothetical protein